MEQYVFQLCYLRHFKYLNPYVGVYFHLEIVIRALKRSPWVQEPNSIEFITVYEFLTQSFKAGGCRPVLKG